MMTQTPSDPTHPRLLYRLTTAEEWRAAVRAGAFTGSAVDTRDGFIHLSTADQVEETARLHYAAVRPLVLVSVDADRLPGDLRWEPSRGGALFPHLYGTIPLEAVLGAITLDEDREGHLIFPLLSNSPGDV